MLAWISLALAIVAAGLLVYFLVRRPPINFATKIQLALGMGILPTAVALTGNVSNITTMETREFCGSCHVMAWHQRDSDNVHSTSLAAVHARIPMLGGDNCYHCHADYGMLGGIVTKLDGMRHVYHYVAEYRNVPVSQAVAQIRLRGEYPNSNCMQCHSTRGPVFLSVGDHAAQINALRRDETSCVSAGCHGPAHPFATPGHVVRP